MDKEVKAEKKESEFLKKLTQGSREIKAQRAHLVSDTTQNAYLELINQKIKKKQEIMYQIQVEEDLSPESTTSLTLGKKLEPNAWVEKIDNLYWDLKNIDESIEVSMKFYNRMFAACEEDKLYNKKYEED